MWRSAFRSIQLAINAQLAREHGGAGTGSEVIYIGMRMGQSTRHDPAVAPPVTTPAAGARAADAHPTDTEGSFIVERVVEIAEAACAALANAAGAPTVDRLLAGIRYYRVHDHLEQMALLHLLDSLVQAAPAVPYSRRVSSAWGAWG